MPSRVAAFAALVFLLAASAVLAGRINGPFLGKINGKASVSNQDGINSGNSTSASPVTFDLDPESSADNLTSSLTINSAAMTLVADYDARDASASSWPADTTGPTLTVAGSDDDPVPDALAPFTGAGESVAFPGLSGGAEAGKYYQSSNGSYSAVGTDDFVFEAFFRAPDSELSNNSQIIGSYSGDAGNPHPPGLFFGPSNEVFVKMTTGAGVDCSGGNIYVPGESWNHVIAFADRNNSIRLYINGAYAATADITACASTLNNANAFLQIGSESPQPIGGGWRLAFARQWKCTSCINTTAEQDAIALERSARLFGAYATAGATKTPEIMTRASVAHTDIQNTTTNVRTLFLLGENAPRVARRKELSGGEYVTGLLMESQRTNKHAYSEDFSLWTISFTDTSDAPAPAGIESDTYVVDAATAPDGTMTADAYDAGFEAFPYEHCFRQNVTTTAQRYTTSFFIKAGEKTTAMVRDRTLTNARAWINLSTCAAGTVGAGLLASKAEDYGNGWCRFSISYTATAASQKIDVCATSADNVTTYAETTGNGSNDMYVWGAQTVAIGSNLSGFVTSYIPSPSSDTVRAKDQIAYVATGNVDTTTGASCDIEMSHIPAFTNSGDDFVTCFVGASSNNNIYGDIYGNNHGMYGTTAGSAVVGFQAGSSILTGERVQARLTFKDSEFCQYVNGSLTGSCDTSGTSPTVPTMTRISLGSTYSGTAQVDALVSRYRYLSGAYAGSLHTY